MFEKALALDPSHPYAVYGLGYSELTSGNFSKAAKQLKRAWELAPEKEEYREEYLQALFGTKEYETLDKLLPTSPNSYSDYKMRANLLVLMNRQDEHPLLKRGFLMNPAGSGYNNYVEMHWAYINRDMEQFSTRVDKCEDDYEKQLFRLQEYIEKSDLRTANQLNGSLPEGYDDLVEPLLAVIENRKGDKTKAKAAFNEFLDSLEQGGQSEAADLGRRIQQSEVSVNEFKDLSVPLERKRVIGLLFCEFAASPSDDWKAAVRELNFSLSFPHNFMESMLK